MEITEEKIAHWIHVAETHWKEHRPEYHADLIQEGELQAALERAAWATARDMEQLMEAGLNEYEAWEAVRERYLLVPPA